MKKPMRKVKKFETGGSANDYKGTDEIVQYRMGQIKDPGIDLFKLTSGEAQEAKPVPLAKKAESAPAKTETKTETKTVSKEPERIFNETGTEFFRNPESGALYNLEPKPEDIRKPAKKTSSSGSSSTSNAKPAEKLAAKTEPKAETKTETKVEPKDDKPVPVKVAKNEKPKTSPKTPGAFAFTDEERAKNNSRLYEGVKSIFSGPAKYIERGSPAMREMRAKDALKSGMASKDRDAMRKGGSVKMASGGKVSSASKRADGCAVRGKTRA